MPDTLTCARSGLGHPPSHYLACIQESRATIERLTRQLATMAQRQRGRRYVKDRIACETRIIFLLERDYQEALCQTH